MIAVLPFVEVTEEKVKAKGLDFTDVSVVKLIKTTVLYKSGDFAAGDEVYFRSDVLKLPYARQKFELDNTKFLLIPEELLVLVSGT